MALPSVRRKNSASLQSSRAASGSAFSPGRAAKWLQEMVGAKADGVIGPQTLTTVEQIDPKKLVADYNAHRLAFLKGLPTFPTFGKGWSNRVAAVTTEALAMTA